ncbi:MAG: hypothetical protein NPIRA06_06730 [Nitrospirales bacterium]|nr:MAG: hypothetical protein NPIRA06_06730 [Nitrospirales bacterium]
MKMAEESGDLSPKIQESGKSGGDSGLVKDLPSLMLTQERSGTIKDVPERKGQRQSVDRLH